MQILFELPSVPSQVAEQSLLQRCVLAFRFAIIDGLLQIRDLAIKFADLFAQIPYAVGYSSTTIENRLVLAFFDFLDERLQFLQELMTWNVPCGRRLMSA